MVMGGRYKWKVRKQVDASNEYPGIISPCFLFYLCLGHDYGVGRRIVSVFSWLFMRLELSLIGLG